MSASGELDIKARTAPLRTTREDLNRNLTLAYFLHSVISYSLAFALWTYCIAFALVACALVEERADIVVNYNLGTIHETLLIIIAEYKPLAKYHVMESDISQASRLS